MRQRRARPLVRASVSSPHPKSSCCLPPGSGRMRRGRGAEGGRCGWGQCPGLCSRPTGLLLPALPASATSWTRAGLRCGRSGECLAQEFPASWPPCLVRIRNLPMGGGFLCAGGHAEKGRLGTEAEVKASFFSGHARLLQGSGALRSQREDHHAVGCRLGFERHLCSLLSVTRWVSYSLKSPSLDDLI